jgi:hypothetical protein
LEIAALTKERYDRNLELRGKALHDYASSLKVKRHVSVPTDPKAKMKNPLWIVNQLKGTGEAGLSTLIKHV